MEKEEATVNRSETNEHAATTLDAPVILPTNPASQDSIGNGSSSSSSSAAADDDDDDDWEAIADLEPDKLLTPVSSDVLTGVSNIKLVDTKSQTPKRRGRGTFSYDKDKLYSDRILDGSIIDDVEEEETQCSSEDKKDTPNSKYGTGHVLVLSHFSPSTRTTDLEKIFEDIKNCDFVIRWVNDTVALAVFRTPAEALEGQSNGRCSFNLSMRILDEDDVLLSSIKANDLKPPQQRPKTSAKAAQRMIANSMGIKLPSPSHGTGTREHKRQEDIRRDRIVNRQKLKDEAWGDD